MAAETDAKSGNQTEQKSSLWADCDECGSSQTKLDFEALAGGRDDMLICDDCGAQTAGKSVDIHPKYQHWG